MVTTYLSAGQRESECPACGASIKSTDARARRVQCPKCRQIVVIGGRGDFPSTGSEAAAADVEIREGTHDRITALEEKVAALEVALTRMATGKMPDAHPVPVEKMKWFTRPGGADYSTEQADVLFHNLGTVPAQDIAIRVAAGDPIAMERATWFRAIFRRAGWIVRGPVELPLDAAGKIITLAVPELPVSQVAAKTYLALKASGFEAMPILDSFPGHGGEAASLALSIPVPKII